MKSGTEKAPSPKTPPLGKFLRSLHRPLGPGYQQLRNGQIVRADTLERWKLLETEGRR